MSAPSHASVSLDVIAVNHVGRGVIAIEIGQPPSPGGIGETPLEDWTPGAHIDVQTQDDSGRPVTRQYSLCGQQGARTWRFAVLADDSGRGGSRWLHQHVRPGARLQVRGPRNHFQLEADQRPVVLVAGGIGITPLMTMAEALYREGRRFRLCYHVRSRASAAFLDELMASAYADQVQLSVDDEGARPLDTLFTPDDAQGWVYTCGPAGFMNGVIAAATACGVPAARVRRELFAADETADAPAPAAGGDRSFVVKLHSSGREITVPAGETVVHALARAGVDVVVSCEQGHCGSCLTRVLQGLPDHRDQFMLPEEHARNDAFTPCCSRSLSSCLVLDL
ncbi:MAG: oxidoreductase [Comamonadaceae bacterium]|nr:MAG: oxidoreductase [Comamonadaceae bacterium]